MLRRIEAQYKRHWNFVDSLWNIYFCEQLNLGLSLSATAREKESEAVDDIEQDIAMQSAKLYEMLRNCCYRDQNQKIRKIDNDLLKWCCAKGINTKRKQIPADVRFRTRNLPGAQEARTKIGKLYVATRSINHPTEFLDALLPLTHLCVDIAAHTFA